MHSPLEFLQRIYGPDAGCVVQEGPFLIIGSQPGIFARISISAPGMPTRHLVITNDKSIEFVNEAWTHLLVSYKDEWWTRLT